QSLTRFAVRGVSGVKHRAPETPLRKPTLTRNAQGKIVIEWLGTWSRQSDSLTQQVSKAGAAGPIYEVTKSSRPGPSPEIKYTTNYASGPFYIRAVDEDGNRIGSPNATM